MGRSSDEGGGPTPPPHEEKPRTYPAIYDEIKKSMGTIARGSRTLDDIMVEIDSMSRQELGDHAMGFGMLQSMLSQGCPEFPMDQFYGKCYRIKKEFLEEVILVFLENKDRELGMIPRDTTLAGRKDMIMAIFLRCIGEANKSYLSKGNKIRPRGTSLPRASGSASSSTGNTWHILDHPKGTQDDPSTWHVTPNALEARKDYILMNNLYGFDGRFHAKVCSLNSDNMNMLLLSLIHI